MSETTEDYAQKAKSIFNFLNQFRENPKLLAKRLEILRTYLDLETNVLSEPNKIQIQMVEGDAVFNEAIHFLKTLSPLEPLEWDNNLAASAMEHVQDIGPKGLLLYQSSDGTEPEDRIAKYGTYTESLGENIDFGPNDALGVIISLTLDDGEDQRPHRENLFKSDYHKVGIACGPHKTEFHMCVMDFAYEFYPLNNKKGNKNVNNRGVNQNDRGNNNANNNYYGNNNMSNNNKVNKTQGPGQNQNQNVGSNNMKPNNTNMANQSPYVKLSLESDDMARANFNFGRGGNNMNNMNNMNNLNNMGNPQGGNYNQPPTGSNSGGINFNEINDLGNQTKQIVDGLRVVEKRVEVTTKITYTYDDGSTKTIQQVQSHTYK